MFHGTKDEIFKYVNEQSLSFYGFKKELMYQRNNRRNFRNRMLLPSRLSV